MKSAYKLRPAAKVNQKIIPALVSHFWKIWGLGRHNFAGFDIGQYQDPGKMDIACLWEQYVAYGDWRSRILRVSISSGLFILMGISLMCIFGPLYPPARGSYTHLLDTIISTTSFLSFCFLTFFVVDVTRLCSYFISSLTARRPAWRPLVHSVLVAAGGIGGTALLQFLDIFNI